MVLLKGLIIGFLIAIPIGPISVLCIQRTLNKGRLLGFISGLGAATADGFYGAIAAFGLVMISNFLIKQQLTIQLIGVIFLLYIGAKSFYSKPKEINPDLKNRRSIIYYYISTLLLTITNPLTILSFTALFVGMGFGFSDGKLESATLLTIGVFLGSALWWLLLSLGIGWIRSKIKNFSLATINKISGFIIICFALLIMANTLR